MKIFVTKSGTTSNWPIKETRISEDGLKMETEESIIVEMTEEEKRQLDEGEVEISFKGIPKLVKSNRKAEREAANLAQKTEKEAAQKTAEILKKKLEKGEANLEEIQTTLAKLL